ncbi:MAG TPA: hypothetical protein PLF81_12265 [Candidatus Anammoximicrobium sp.]|nr:hypothetical protein [Candidatus Anammoximicrobium sp.]
MSDGSEVIADHEILYRRIPAASGFFDPQVDPNPSPLAFRPTRHDTTGLSLSRAKYKSLEEAGCGREGKQYYVAVLRAGELRRLGMDIVPRPLEDDPGHCEIADLNFGNRKAMPFAEWQSLLAEQLCLRVEGPFPELPTIDASRQWS